MFMNRGIGEPVNRRVGETAFLPRFISLSPFPRFSLSPFHLFISASPFLQLSVSSLRLQQLPKQILTVCSDLFHISGKRIFSEAFVLIDTGDILVD